MHVITLNCESYSLTVIWKLPACLNWALWLLTVWSQSGFGSTCAGQGCSVHGRDTTSEMFRHLRVILQALISEFLQWKFSILSTVILSHTVNFSCKTNVVDKCSHDLAVSDITWRISSVFILFMYTIVSADIIRGLGFWQWCFSHLLQSKVYSCWRQRLFLWSYLHLSENYVFSSPFNSVNLLRMLTSQWLTEASIVRLTLIIKQFEDKFC